MADTTTTTVITLSGEISSPAEDGSQSITIRVPEGLFEDIEYWLEISAYVMAVGVFVTVVWYASQLFRGRRKGG